MSAILQLKKDMRLLNNLGEIKDDVGSIKNFARNEYGGKMCLSLDNSYWSQTFEKKFPVLVVREDFTLKELKKKCKCEGYIEELHIILLRKLKKIQNSDFYFNKLHYFCKKYELTFLDKTYFEDIRNKLSLL